MKKEKAGYREKKFVIDGKTYTTSIKNKKELKRFVETLKEIGIDLGINPKETFSKNR